jgi:hypothetical protein
MAMSAVLTTATPGMTRKSRTEPRTARSTRLLTTPATTAAMATEEISTP